MATKYYTYQFWVCPRSKNRLQQLIALFHAVEDKAKELILSAEYKRLMKIRNRIFHRVIKKYTGETWRLYAE